VFWEISSSQPIAKNNQPFHASIYEIFIAFLSNEILPCLFLQAHVGFLWQIKGALINLDT
jgi:hypothetical protein